MTATLPESLAPLPEAVDWREPQRRFEAFHDFYTFHLKHRAHPGCVYFLIPYLRHELGWDDEQTLWYAFINGNTQNPVTSLLLHNQGSRPNELMPMLVFYQKHYEQLAWDTDRRYHRKSFAESVAGYLMMLDGQPQMDFWREASSHGFAHLWQTVSAIPTFGRLSAWSMCDYLHICGIDININTLMLGDKSGSRSHRNGLCIVNNLDAYDWHASNPTFDGSYPPRLIKHLQELGEQLMDEAKYRARGKPWERDVNYLTLESALCTYKSWHRPNRRYVGVYVDMLHSRLEQAAQRFPEEDFTVFWAARNDCLPNYLLQEITHDGGVTLLKQNHYRLTGEIPVMGREWPKYWSAFDQWVVEH